MPPPSMANMADAFTSIFAPSRPSDDVPLAVVVVPSIDELGVAVMRRWRLRSQVAVG